MIADDVAELQFGAEVVLVAIDAEARSPTARPVAGLFSRW